MMEGLVDSGRMGTPRNDEHGLVCASCGYSLVGLPSPVRCPECGGLHRPAAAGQPGMFRRLCPVLVMAVIPTLVLLVAVCVYGWDVLIGYDAGWLRLGLIAAGFLVLHPGLVIFEAVHARRGFPASVRGARGFIMANIFLIPWLVFVANALIMGVTIFIGFVKGLAALSAL